jgi:hypothetical protein
MRRIWLTKRATPYGADYWDTPYRALLRRVDAREECHVTDQQDQPETNSQRSVTQYIDSCVTQYIYFLCRGRFSEGSRNLAGGHAVAHARQGQGTEAKVHGPKGLPRSQGGHKCHAHVGNAE